MTQKSFTDMATEELVARMGVPGSMNSQAVMAELTRRQTEAQIEAARWMRWSVVALTSATILNLAMQVGLQISN